jgi:hypothetical protein
MTKTLVKFLCAALTWLALVSASWGVTLLPNGKQQFLDANGKPLAGGKVYMYVPGTTTPKNTWKNAAGTILNANPIILDTSGEAVIYGSGLYRQVVTTSTGVTIWDQQTADTSSTSGVAWAGNGGGTANAQTITSASFVQSDGQIIYYRPTFTNSGPMTLSVNGGSPIGVYRDLPAGGVQLLEGGEVASGNVVGVAYSTADSFFHLITNNYHPYSTGTNIAGGPTTDIGAYSTNILTVTGSGATITSFGSSAKTSQGLFFILFQGTNTIQYNATSLWNSSGQNIYTNSGDAAIAVYTGSGNWYILSYIPSYFGSGINSQSGTTYTILSSDRGKTIEFTNTAQVTVTVPRATGTFGSGFRFTLSNPSSSLVVANFTTSTLSGLSSISIPLYGSITLASDGTNWVQESGLLMPNTVTINPVSGGAQTVNIPSWAKSIKVAIGGVIGTGTSNVSIRLFANGSVVNTGYSTLYTSGNNAVTTATSSTELCLAVRVAAGDAVIGTCEISWLGTNGGSTTWVGSGIAHNTNASHSFTLSNGTITLANQVTAVQIDLGASTFSSGSISVTYQ